MNIKIKKEFIGAKVYSKVSNSFVEINEKSAQWAWMNGRFEMIDYENVTPIPKPTKHRGNDTKRAGNGRKSSVRTARKK